MQVEALVLSLGEATTERAIESLRRQTVALADINIVRNVSPFHTAMNKGVESITAPFFIQCDADMVLDPDCVEVLISHLDHDVAVVAAFLDDPLMGKIQAVKLFRTHCVRQAGFPDHVSPDTALIDALIDRGYRLVYASRETPAYGHDEETLGVHDPEYSPLYTFQKFRIEGSRMAMRGRFGELTTSLELLAHSRHNAAKIAMIGLCRGIFDERGGDRLAPYIEDEDFRTLKRYLDGVDRTPNVYEPLKKRVGSSG